MTTVNSPAITEPGAFAGLQVAAKAVNAQGGLGKGKHPLEVVTCDQELNATKAVGCVTKAADDKAVALLGSADFTGQIYPALKKAGLSNVGEAPLAPIDFTDPRSYPFTGLVVSSFIGSGPILKEKGFKKIYVISLDTAGSLSTAKTAERGIKATHGLTFAGHVAIPAAGSPDFAPIAQKVKSSGADAVLGIMGDNIYVPFMKAYKALGGNQQFVQYGVMSPKDLKESSSLLNGILGITVWPPPNESGAKSFPAVQEFLNEMSAGEKAGVKGAGSVDLFSFNSWLSAFALKSLLADVEGPITSETVNQALTKGKDLDVKGILKWSPSATGPKEWPRVTNSNVYSTKIENGSETLTSPQAVDVFKSLGYTS